jgi:hypothetical protein
MATVNLLPNKDDSNDFTISTGSLAYAVMDDDHTGNITTDGSYLSSTTSGSTCQFRLSSFTESADSIDSVQVVVKAGNNGRGASFEIGMTMVNGTSGNFYAQEGSGTQAASAGYRTISYTNRTTSDGSNAWTTDDLKALRIALELTAHSGGTFRTTYCYAIVTYTEAVATDNSIFFGTNF